MTIILMKYKIRWVINKYLEIIVGLEMYVNNINLQCMAQQANSPPELYVRIYSLGGDTIWARGRSRDTQSRSVTPWKQNQRTTCCG